MALYFLLCVVSLWGHFLNAYGPAQTLDPSSFGEDGSNAVEPFAGSMFYSKASKKTLCYLKEADQCHAESPVCHNLEPEDMERYNVAAMTSGSST